MTDDLKLAETFRATLGAFVRKTRQGAGTASDARSETLGALEREGALSAAMLARQRGVSHQTMRVILVDLAAEGLVTASPDPLDGRASLFQLTGAGRSEVTRQRQARAQWLAEAWVAHLTPDERRTVEAMLPLMQRLAGPET